MMMLGGVPIRVTSPPRIAPKESGISTTAGERLALRADCSATGIKSPSVPTLFMKADMAAARLDSTPMWLAVAPVAGRTARAIQSVAPVAVSERLRIRIAATVMVAGWPKPANAWSVGTTPATTAAMSARIATTS